MVSLSLNKHHTMKMHWDGDIAPRIFNLGARWRWVVSLTPRRFILDTRLVGWWVGLGAGLDAVANKKKSHNCPCRELNTGRPSSSHVSILTELPRRGGRKIIDGFAVRLSCGGIDCSSYICSIMLVWSFIKFHRWFRGHAHGQDGTISFAYKIRKVV